MSGNLIQDIEEELAPPASELLVVAREGSALDGLSQALAHAQRFRLSVARTARAALAALHAGVAVALVELTLDAPERTDAGQNGLELCRALRQASPELWLVMVTPPDCAAARVRAFHQGVQDCVSESLDPRELRALLGARFDDLERRSGRYRVFGDARPLRAESIDRRTTELTQPYGLSPREAQVLGLIARGVHPKEVADRLGCGYASVRTHLRRLSKKLGCGGTREIVVRFFCGEVEP